VEALPLRYEWSGLAFYLLAWTVPLGFCAGLFALSVSSVFEVVIPRWLILAHGGGCVLVALVAPLLSLPWQHRRTAGQQAHRPSIHPGTSTLLKENRS
jgi:hypothetical protein